MSRSEYAEAVERQSEWLRFSESPLGDALWREMAEESRNPAERIVFEAPLRQGEVVYVASEFCDLIDVAMRTLPETTFRPDLVPMPIGWAWLERPLELPMIEGVVEEARRRAELARAETGLPFEPELSLKVNAIGWFSQGGVYHFAAYSMNPQTETARFYSFAPGDRGRPMREPFWPIANWMLQGGEGILRRIDEFEAAAAPESRYVRKDVHEMRYAFAMMLLLNQRILSTRREPIDRAARRRQERAGRGEHDHLQVVVLRRYEERGPDAGPAREVDWSCRWIVRGHWRQQYYPSTGDHRPRWILPYVKGPEDRPMKDDQRRVYAAIR